MKNRLINRAFEALGYGVMAIAVLAFVLWICMAKLSAQTPNADRMCVPKTIIGENVYTVLAGDTIWDGNNDGWEQIVQHPRNSAFNTPQRRYVENGVEVVKIFPGEDIFIPAGMTFEVCSALTAQASAQGFNPAAYAQPVFVPIRNADSISKADFRWLLAALLVMGLILAWMLRRERRERKAGEVAIKDFVLKQFTETTPLSDAITKSVEKAHAETMKALEALQTDVREATTVSRDNALLALQSQEFAASMLHGNTPKVPLPFHRSDAEDDTRVIGTRRSHVIVRDLETGETEDLIVHHGSTVCPTDDGAEIIGRGTALFASARNRERAAMAQHEQARDSTPAASGTTA